MRARNIEPYELAKTLVYLWSKGDDVIWWNILSIINLLGHSDQLRRLYLLCKKRNIGYDWTIQALVWYLNNI